MKAALTRNLPYELLSYASKKPVFPRDSTSDQWFDHGQFDAYQELGRYLGERAADAARRPPDPAQPPVPDGRVGDHRLERRVTPDAFEPRISRRPRR
jgi:hypothetical protein